MPNVKISQLASAAALDGSEELPIVQNGVTVKATSQEVANLSSLTYTAENVANKVQDILTNVPSSAKYPSVDAVKSYVDDTTAGLLDDRGSFSPSATSPGAFPSTGGSGGGGAILKGDIWFLANNGFLGTTAVLAGGSVRALANSPASASDWDILDTNIIPIQNLQQVLNQGTILVDGVNFQGSSAASGNTGVEINAFGNNAGFNNSGNDCNFMGVSAGENNSQNYVNGFGQGAVNDNSGESVNGFGIEAAKANTGNYVNAMGASAAVLNSGANVNAFGTAAGLSNNKNCVNLFGPGATADDNNQNVLAVQPTGGAGPTYNARHDYNGLTSNRKYTFPDKSGTVAMLSDVGGGVSAVTIPLTSSQVKNANSVPTELIPAPGAGKIINIIRSSYVYTYGTTTYIVSLPPYIAYKTAFSYLSVAVLNSLAVANSTYVNIAANPSIQLSVSAIENTPIYYQGPVDPLVGDGTLKITIVYTIIDL